MKKILFLLVYGFSFCGSLWAQTSEYQNVWCADKGDGTYVNPVINGDFPDIDVVFVDGIYYMVSTTMYHFPGATILKSKDLVNWEYCANPLEQVLDNDAYNLLNGKHHYAQGMWASSLTYHDGQFYLYFPCSTWSEDSQSILLTAEDPEGKWKLTRLPEGYHDPGWLFDDGEKGDGFLYVACGINDIWVNKFNAKTLQKISSAKAISVQGGCEGSHMYHIGDYYYIYATYNTEASQTIFRSKNPMGPYEECDHRVFSYGRIHQGALIQTQTGEWWTMIFRDAGAIGRIPYLEPVKWVDGWPVIGKNGKDVSENGASYKKPNVGKTYEKKYLPTNDAFIDTKLGMQWQWNHNPDPSAWSLTERPGHLRLYTANVTNELHYARNSLTQRILGYSPNGTSSSNYKTTYGTVKMDLSGMQEGDVAGLAVFQNPYSFISVKMEGGKKYLYSERCTFNNQKLNKVQSLKGAEVTSDVIYLLAYVNFGTNECKYYYSYDNVKWTKWGVTMNMGYTLDYFVGQRFYLFNYATQHLGGFVDYDWFTTERNFSEEAFGIEDPTAAYTEADKTMTSLAVSETAMTLLVGGVQSLDVMMTAQSGMERDVASACTYTFSQPDVVEVSGGRILALRDGETDVTATYADEKGNTQSVTFHVTAAAFPLKEGLFNPSLISTGSFMPSIGSIGTGKNGLAGWQYASGIDMSAAKYLVVRFRRSPTVMPTFLFYDESTTQGTPCSYEMAREKEVVIDLQGLKKTNGKALDLSHIYLAGFQLPQNSTVYVKELFLSNDGENPTGISALMVADPDFDLNATPASKSQWYDIQGRPVAHPAHGIYIHEGKQVWVP